MRKYFMTAFVLVAMLVFATSGLALEKTAVRVNPSDTQGWDAATSCSVFYANTCTGWLWVWSPWSPSDELGVIMDPCCTNGQLTQTQVRMITGSPPGYGFTGTLAVSSVVGGCPGVVYQSIPFTPIGGFPGTLHNWTVPSGPVAFTFTVSSQTDPVDPLMAIPTDHPAAGPTGPAACGYCYPSTRTIHSFYFGTAGTLCPGSPFFDGLCNAELYGWGGLFTCPPVSVEETSWGAVKSLYR
jgi:hypothetical protein